MQRIVLKTIYGSKCNTKEVNESPNDNAKSYTKERSAECLTGLIEVYMFIKPTLLSTKILSRRMDEIVSILLNIPGGLWMNLLK